MKELGRGTTASLNTAKALREESSIAHNHVKTLSHDLSSSQSKGVTITKELTQDILTYIAKQPVNQGPDGASGGDSGKIGYEGARQILERGGETRAAYIKRFQEENPQYTVQSINSSQEQTRLNQDYNREAGNMQRNFASGPQCVQQTQEVLAQGKKAGLDTESLNKTSIERTSLASSHLLSEGESVKGAQLQGNPSLSPTLQPASFSLARGQSFSGSHNIQDSSLSARDETKNQGLQNQGKAQPQGKGEDSTEHKTPTVTQQKPLAAEQSQQETLSSPGSQAQQDINAFISGITKKIEDGQKETNKKENDLKKSEEEAQQKSLAKTAFANAADSVAESLPLPPPLDPSTLIIP